jgi:hypothetical protein
VPRQCLATLSPPTRLAFEVFKILILIPFCHHFVSSAATPKQIQRADPRSQLTQLRQNVKPLLQGIVEEKLGVPEDCNPWNRNHGASRGSTREDHLHRDRKLTARKDGVNSSVHHVNLAVFLYLAHSSGILPYRECTSRWMDWVSSIPALVIG